MFLFLLVALSALLAAAAPTQAASQRWFTLEWDAPQFTALSGSFIVPELSKNSGNVFIWPGLQGSDGALQAELSGSSNGLQLRNVFYGQSTTSAGTPTSSRLAVTPGSRIHFEFFQMPGTNKWITTLSDRFRVATFVTPSSVKNRAIFAIELVNGGTPDFDVQFNGISITAATTSSASDWCTKVAFNGFSAQSVSIQGATALKNKCTIDQIILPASV